MLGLSVLFFCYQWVGFMRVFLYAEITERSPSGEPFEQRMGAALLEGDAPFVGEF